MQFSKRTYEKYTPSIDFTGRLPVGATPSSGTAAATDLITGSSVSAVLVSTALTVSGNNVSVGVQAGTAGHSYKIKLDVVLSNADQLEEALIMHVLD